jgi:hypothetical protein
VSMQEVGVSSLAPYAAPASMVIDMARAVYERGSLPASIFYTPINRSLEAALHRVPDPCKLAPAVAMIFSIPLPVLARDTCCIR